MPRLSNTATATRQQNTQDVQLAFYRQYLTLTAGQNTSHMLLVATPLPSLPVDCHCIQTSHTNTATSPNSTFSRISNAGGGHDATHPTTAGSAVHWTVTGVLAWAGAGVGTKVDSGGGGPQPTAYGGAAGDLTSEMDEADGIHNPTFFALIHILFNLCFGLYAGERQGWYSRIEVEMYKI